MGILDKRSNLQGRKAGIIGGAEGIGKAVIMGLSESEVGVAFLDINEPGVRKTKAEAEASRRNVIAEVADALDPIQLRRFYSAVEAAFGHVDMVVNIVGGVLMQPFMEKTRESCERDIQRNF